MCGMDQSIVSKAAQICKHKHDSALDIVIIPDFERLHSHFGWLPHVFVGCPIYDEHTTTIGIPPLLETGSEMTVSVLHTSYVFAPALVGWCLRFWIPPFPESNEEFLLFIEGRKFLICGNLTTVGDVTHRGEFCVKLFFALGEVFGGQKIESS